MTSKGQWFRRLIPLFGVSLFAAALWMLFRELQARRFQEVMSAILDIPRWQVLAGLAVVGIDYLVITGYDTLGARYIRRRISYAKSSFAAFVSHSFSNNIGFAFMSGGSMRMHIYSGWGLTPLEIVRLTVFCSATFWVGFLALAGVLFLVEPLQLPGSPLYSFMSAKFLGVVFLLCTVALVARVLASRRPVCLGSWQIDLPSPRLLFMQVLVGGGDWVLSGLILYVLLPETAQINFGLFLAAYLFAQTIGLFSQVPGGLGVFETVLLLQFRGQMDATELLGAILVYRGVYYLVPLSLAALLFGVRELAQRHAELRKLARSLGEPSGNAVPDVLAVAAFVGGTVLLLSSAWPANPQRLAWLRDLLPLFAIEAAHFTSALAGIGLMLTAPGLQRRLEIAYLACVGLLAAGIFLSLAKGGDWPEATILASMLVALLPCRPRFHRRASLLGEKLPASWTTATLVILGATLWVGLFAHKNVPFRDDLWWHFSLRSDVTRFLRAMAGVLVAAAAYAIFHWRSLRAARQLPDMAPPPFEQLLGIIAEAPHPTAWLAMLGDKHFFASPSGRSFLMYGVQGRTWVVMGDPIGAVDEWAELVWNFREACDRLGVLPVFYEVGDQQLHLYLDTGLTPLVVGERAWVPLANFDLGQPSHAELRQCLEQVESTGCAFAVHSPAETVAMLPRLREISDDWLREKQTAEKGFSQGFFNEDYLRLCPIATASLNGVPVAFANLLVVEGRKWFSLDLLRYTSAAPAGVMVFTIARLLEWAAANGYERADLGLAPLAGLEEHPLLPLWNRFGSQLFTYGEHFYNFQGVRTFKEKFGPQWQPAHIAFPGLRKLPRIIADLGALIAPKLPPEPPPAKGAHAAAGA